ncbi:MAG: hypothetical protein KGI50_04115 [Patescibacteria group bacterium]|nr:hypothetical protein [Patescibacteria group bacterium]MDE2438529.1 hypothetical protein [Patescibacteria group bacterium]
MKILVGAAVHLFCDILFWMFLALVDAVTIWFLAPLFGAKITHFVSLWRGIFIALYALHWALMMSRSIWRSCERVAGEWREREQYLAWAKAHQGMNGEEEARARLAEKRA